MVKKSHVHGCFSPPRGSLQQDNTREGHNSTIALRRGGPGKTGTVPSFNAWVHFILSSMKGILLRPKKNLHNFDDFLFPEFGDFFIDKELDDHTNNCRDYSKNGKINYLNCYSIYGDREIRYIFYRQE